MLLQLLQPIHPTRDKRREDTHHREETWPLEAAPLNQALRFPGSAQLLLQRVEGSESKY